MNIAAAKDAALHVLRHNARGLHGLPRVAGWGYPEPYTRDLMISSLGFLISGDLVLINILQRVLESLARHQSPHGQIPGLAHTPHDLGSSDTTPLFLIALALFRQTIHQPDFLDDAAQKALNWMIYQSSDDRGLVAQQPTSDWRDEQWVLGYGLYVNTLMVLVYHLYGFNEQANRLRQRINRPVILSGSKPAHVLEGLAVPHQSYYALWSYKVHSSTRFDLLGNSLAMLSGITSPSKTQRLITWVESSCQQLRAQGDLAGDLPPCFFPYIRPTDPDWHPRYHQFNRPGEYHNGGIWPFICGLYIAALVKAGRFRLAERKLFALTNAMRPAREAAVEYGFNEWLRAQDSAPAGQDWQTWSAALYLYAAHCVEHKQTSFF
ncbi:MAG TPA: glycoside hydrolase 100 family protein [Phototrophicaceae bacterium]|nr:glycoside hydrolase 100 family protein [Phototrophicaceae bacterium]